MAFRLPPLSSLRVFEAAARHNSFRKAAGELNLTASAVSHGIQTLENWLGVELFHRGARGLRLTDAGRAYAPLVTQALSVLAKATDQLPGRKATGTLSVTSAPTFANKILLPRLAKFALAFPDIRVTIDTSQRLVDLALDDFDIAIRFSPLQRREANWTLLGEETLLPVCSPSLKAQYAGLSDAEVTARAPLIHLTALAPDWSHWFQSTGTKVPASIDGGLRVDTMQMAFDAAKRGFGVVLGRRPLIDDDIESGRLVPLAARAIASGSGHWLVTADTDFQKPEVKLFRDWLLSELDGTKGGKSARSGGPKNPPDAVRAAPRQPKQATKPARIVSKKTAVP